MATQKPISTISYNTEAFLKEKLDSWVKSHIIQTYQYICHKGEDGDKDHIHVRIEPNKKLDPMDLSEALTEYTRGSDKPLRCRPWRPSKEEDWILYAVHDKEYLNLKYNGGEKGEKLPYLWTDIRVPDTYDMEIAFVRAKAYLQHSTVNIATRIQKGENPLSMVLQGENPYTVSAIARTVYTSDYQRLQQHYTKLENDYYALLDAIEEFGLEIVVDENGIRHLSIPESD